MGVVVAFDYAAWQAQYPEFAAVGAPAATGYFGLATSYQRNDGGGPISNATIQLSLLNLLVSHLAALYSQSQGDPSPGSPQDANTPVGRISGATKGSISVQTEYGGSVSQQQAWAIQTKYGAQWWAMTAQYRTMRYLPGCGPPGAFGRFATPSGRG